MTTSTDTCRICGNSENNKHHTAREMMFGTREEFVYLECVSCGTLQLTEVPNLAPYYPKNYLSFDARSPTEKSIVHKIAACLIGKYLVTGRSLSGKFIQGRLPGFANNLEPSLLHPSIKIKFDSKILDFGSGSGRLLTSLHYFGFTDLTGADAFIENDIFYPTGVKIYKRRLDEMDPGFDLIMLHHAFEHVPDPRETLTEIKRILNPDGTCLIRIPVKNYAWEKYGVDWVQLDSPRHLFLYTENSLKLIANECGFEVADVVYDSSAFQFWGSEQYKQEIPLVLPNSGGEFTNTFSAERVAAWEAEAQKLNKEKRGDAAAFYLKHR